MLELVDLDRQLAKEEYKPLIEQLQLKLGACQRAARSAGVPVIVVFEGWDAAGKGNLINALTQPLDPRGFKVHTTSAANEVERFFPWMRRFHTPLPGSGEVAIYDSSWYARVLGERLDKLVSRREWQQAYDEIEEFERQLSDAGYVIVKLWLHIDKKEQRRRFKQLERHRSTAWKVGAEEWRHHRQYDRWIPVVEEMLERTNTAHASWTIVEATHGRYARVRVFETVIQAIEKELEKRTLHPAPRPQPMAEPEQREATQANILQRVDLSLSLQREGYEQQLAAYQKQLYQLEHELYAARIPAVLVYEGWDAAGKGGNIRRLTQGLDPRGYEVVPIAAPTAEEKAHHFLWRFWRAVPKAGHITIFDRSWYGRVMVERVEGFCNEDDWRRSYREINEFERQLAQYGAVIVKFWLHIDQDEQLRRFEARQATADKQWKITDEDWRNRAQWRKYEVAVSDMLQQTSTTYAPWTILEANCKLHGRIKALRTVAQALEEGLARAARR